METLILKIAAIAGAISTIIAFVWKPLKAVHDRRKREKADLAAYRAGVASAIEEIKKSLQDYGEDIAYVQRYDLKMAHASLMTQGWCSPETKAAVIDLYDHYSGERKRNSLAESYRRDIDSLPHTPPESI